MTVFQLRTDRDQSLDPDPDLLVLDWWRGDQRSTVHSTWEFLRGLAPSSVAMDFLALSVAVYCADKVALRRAAADGWTRELEVRVPVTEPDRFETARPRLIESLDFLTGDRWNLGFRPRARGGGQTCTSRLDAESVCLFSGGLDSLAGAIDLLHDGSATLLLGHHDGGIIAHTQTSLRDGLAAHFGRGSARLRQLFLAPATATTRQARPLPPDREDTTRSRSLLFIAAGLAIADGLGPGAPLYMPENGFIGINVPLVPARTGSLSTRTTHPYFLSGVGEVCELLDIGHRIENPYRLRTKGEVLRDCRNTELLSALALGSLSCAHPSAGRWRKRPQGNCGYCWPCLIRRSSMHHVGWDAPDQYSRDAMSEDELLDSSSEAGASLRAMLASMGAPSDRYAVLHNGPIPSSETLAFDEVYRRGRTELRAWLDSGASSAVRRQLQGA